MFPGLAPVLVQRLPARVHHHGHANSPVSTVVPVRQAWLRAAHEQFRLRLARVTQLRHIPAEPEEAR